MNRFLDEYVRMGLTDIAELEESFEESEAGYGSHTATAAIVARKETQFIKMIVSEHATFGFKAKRRFGITSENPISEEIRRGISSPFQK